MEILLMIQYINFKCGKKLFSIEASMGNQSQSDVCNGTFVDQMTTNMLLNGNMNKDYGQSGAGGVDYVLI